MAIHLGCMGSAASQIAENPRNALVGSYCRTMAAGRQVRWWLGLGLIGIGAAALVVAALLPTYLMPRLTRIPSDIHTEAISLADNASVIDVGAGLAGHMRTETGVPIKVQTLVVSAQPTDADRVTLVATTRLLRSDRDGPNAMVTARAEAVTLSRTTSEPVDPVGQIKLEVDKPADRVSRSGFQYHFPFDTQKQSYLYFDTTARRDIPIDYVDDDRHEGGLRLLHFRQSIGPINLYPEQPDMQMTLPASWWGLPGEQQTRFDLHYSNTRDIWVEPTSGAIVEQREHVRRFLARTVDDPLAVTTLEIRTRFDEQSLAEAVHTARQARMLIRWGNLYAPILLAAAGIAMVAAGLLIRWRATEVDDRDITGVDDHHPDGRKHVPVQDISVEHRL
ncbi:DUF3068 domain-containing protein [Nocardia arthritidis]|uniref:DUF3068 domain-containing protein n=1 Tax=Nocardia arthritidis TaxID=228602 RepID=A0A6G9Y9L1_9NOCA|nr:DUF3068 domain-containing protein [Nocardia arthritidis]QIS09810.1 DUF3068 domain-containing protein [Nocardia arthritidis]